MNTHAWDIYAEQMYCHGHGYPIWCPDPDPAFCQVRIGGVGYLKKGGFMQLFNSMKDVNEQPLAFGVPENFVPFNPPNLIVTGPHERISPPMLRGHTIREVDVAAGAQAGVAPLPVSGGASWSFKCSADSGAFLLFDPIAYSRDIESKRHVVNYIREHHAHWVDFVSKFGLDVREEDILFISGTTMTSKWAVAAFHGQYRKKQGMIRADLSSYAALDLSVSISDESLPQGYHSSGPRRRGALNASAGTQPDQESLNVDEADQCIFLHYYKMKRRVWLYRHMKAGAGPHELPSPGPDEAGSRVVADDEEVGSDEEFDEVPRSRKPFDPVDDLLEYILQENSEAMIAIASDRDLFALFKDEPFPEDIASAIQRVRPAVDVDENGVGTLSVVLDLHKPRVEDETPVEDNKDVVEGTQASHDPQVDGEGTPEHGQEQVDHEDDEEEEGGGLRKLINPAAPTSVHDGSVTTLAYSEDGTLAASGSEDTTIIVWEPHHYNARYKRSGHKDTVSTLAFSKDNQFLASGSNDRKIVIWRVEGGAEVKRIDCGVPVHSLAYTPDGTKLIAGGYDGSLRIWDSETYDLLRLVAKHLAVITFIVFSPDHRFMATGGTESNCYIWDVANLEEGEPRSILRGHGGMICSAAFSSTGRRIITASDDGSSRVWNAETGEALVILHEHVGPVWSVAFSPDDKRIASGSSDSTVKVCDSFSGDRLLALDGHDNMVNVVEFSPNGKFIASAASDNTVRLWNAGDGETIATFNEHCDNVTVVQFAPDSSTLASGSHDGSVRIRSLVGL